MWNIFKVNKKKQQNDVTSFSSVSIGSERVNVSRVNIGDFLQENSSRFLAFNYFGKKVPS